MHTKIKELLQLAVSNKVSDLHLTVGEVPKFRLNGELIAVTTFSEISNDVMTEMILSLLSEDQIKRLKEDKELDFSVAIPESRFRVNAYYQKELLAASLRVIPSEIPTFTELNLPPIFREFGNFKQGFILVTGPTGQGKSTTVASILNDINTNQNTHIVTIEDPVEYIIQPKKALISQREVGTDTKSFAGALRSCLRQDPNVVFNGEMRDLETISTSLTIAETGHLVFSTLHTNSAAQSIDRIVDVFPEGSKEQIRVQLASVITAIVSQRLVPAIDGGRVPVFEILLATPAVRNTIREGKSFMIDNIIQTSADIGMISMEGSLARLVKQGKITEEVAMNYSLRPSELQNVLRNTKIIENK